MRLIKKRIALQLLNIRDNFFCGFIDTVIFALVDTSIMLIRNALTIDVEDYYQVSNFERHIPRNDWSKHPCRVRENTQRLLQTLDKYGVKATFFILGYVAERHPNLVKDIDAAGHEIGSHSYWHRLVYELTSREFREDLRRSRDILQDIISKPVTAYRSPSFSITTKSLWALEILVEEGFQSDSSIFPIYHNRYGIPNAHRHPHSHQFQSGQLWEFPITVFRLGNRWNFPISGGGYFRLLPLALTIRLLQRVNEECLQPFVFYTHPWEYDPEQPRLNAGTQLQRFRHYVNLSTTEAKLERLMQSFSFGRMDDVLKKYVGTVEAPVATTSLA